MIIVTEKLYFKKFISCIETKAPDKKSGAYTACYTSEKFRQDFSSSPIIQLPDR